MRASRRQRSSPLKCRIHHFKCRIHHCKCKSHHFKCRIHHFKYKSHHFNCRIHHCKYIVHHFEFRIPYRSSLTCMTTIQVSSEVCSTPIRPPPEPSAFTRFGEIAALFTCSRTRIQNTRSQNLFIFCRRISIDL